METAILVYLLVMFVLGFLGTLVIDNSNAVTVNLSSAFGLMNILAVVALFLL